MRNISDSYNKIEEGELLEGDSKHIGYIGIMDQLTINEENRLKRRVTELTIKADKVDQLAASFEEVKRKLGIN